MPNQHSHQSSDERVNILLVDDRPENLLALQATLGDLGQNLVYAESGEDALRRTLETDFAVILLDVSMPGMSGVEAANLIRRRPKTKATPILFLTAHQATEFDLVNSYQAGGVDYLIKPFNPEILRAKVSLFIEMNKQRREMERQTEMLRRSMLTIVEERKRTAEERRRRQELEEFAHIASHDLKEPLRAIHSFSQLLMRNHGGEFSADAKEYFSHIVEGSSRINRLVDDLIEYAQVGSNRATLQAVEVSDVVRETVRRMQSRVDEVGATIQYDALPRLQANPRQLGLVFEHLLDNALKFHGDQRPQISIRATFGVGRWLFEIRDNGIGFDPRFADRIFLLFKRLHRRNEFDGNGFGLALCKRIIERHGGRIWAEAEVGRGATIFFALPEVVNVSGLLAEA